MTADDGLVDRMVKAGKSDPEILDQLYWATCGRAPRGVIPTWKCYAPRQSTSFNDPSREAEKEVKISHECRG